MAARQARAYRAHEYGAVDQSDGSPIPDGGDYQESDDASSVEEGEGMSEEEKEQVRKAFKEYIEGEEFSNVDKHIFRYVVRKLGDAEDPLGVDYCIESILDGQSDPRRILHQYIQHLDDKDAIADRLADAVTEGDVRYDYHEFVLLRWFYRQEINTTKVIHCARQVLDQSDGIIEGQEYAIAILSEHGDYPDWERIQVMYGDSQRELTKAIIAFAVRQFEKGRRKEFYNYIDGNHAVVDRAIEVGDR